MFYFAFMTTLTVHPRGLICILIERQEPEGLRQRKEKTSLNDPEIFQRINTDKGETLYSWKMDGRSILGTLYCQRRVP